MSSNGRRQNTSACLSPSPLTRGGGGVVTFKECQDGRIYSVSQKTRKRLKKKRGEKQKSNPRILTCRHFPIFPPPSLFHRGGKHYYYFLRPRKTSFIFSPPPLQKKIAWMSHLWMGKRRRRRRRRRRTETNDAK